MDESHLKVVEMRRAQRRAELEEKKARLAEVQAQNASAPVVSSELAQSQAATFDLSIDELLKGIDIPSLNAPVAAAPGPDLALPPAAAVASNQAPNGTGAGSAPAASLSTTDDQQEKQRAAATKRRVELYTKGTQTPTPAKPAVAAAAAAADQDLSEGADAGGPEPSVATAGSTVDGDDKSLTEDGSQPAESEPSALVPPAEAEAVLRSPAFSTFIESSAAAVERALHLSQRFEYLDVLTAAEDAQRAADQGSGANEADLTLAGSLFDDRSCRRRAVSALAWTGPGAHRDLCAAAYSAASGVTLDPDGLVCVWSPDNLLGRAEFTLRCQSAITAVCITSAATRNTQQLPGGGTSSQQQQQQQKLAGGGSPIVIGGTYSGQVVMWDLRAGPNPVQQAAVSAGGGHTHPIYSLTTTGTTADTLNLCTCSTDGHVCFWALDSLAEPLESLDLYGGDEVSGAGDGRATGSAALTNGSGGASSTPGAAATGAAGPGSATKKSAADSPSSKSSVSSGLSLPVAATALQFASHDANVFFVGAEEGCLYQGYRHGAKRGITGRFNAHAGPVTAVDCCTCRTGGGGGGGGPSTSSRLLLTSSVDWTCKLWSTRRMGRGPLLALDTAADAVYDVKWSPVHPAVFASGAGDGQLSLWNLLRSTEVPVAQMKPGAAINKLCWSSDGTKLVAGDVSGNCHLFTVGRHHHRKLDPVQRKQFDSLINSL